MLNELSCTVYCVASVRDTAHGSSGLHVFAMRSAARQTVCCGKQHADSKVMVSCERAYLCRLLCRGMSEHTIEGKRAFNESNNTTLV